VCSSGQCSAGLRPPPPGSVWTMPRWEAHQPGVLGLPSGRVVRGRGLRAPLPEGPHPEFGLYLQAKAPPTMTWPARWVRWRDWWLPADPADARDALIDVWRRAETHRVEVACSGGRGRTGTALACVAILDGIAPAEAVGYVRKNYHPRAVETPWQQHFVARFGDRLSQPPA
jgi:Protein-tyrosine phosphatase